ncbi:MAG: homoserine dehydrogenase, partial [Gemmatimonadaceae bacterium]
MSIPVARRRPAPADVVLLGAGAIGRELIAQLTAGNTSSSLRICGLIDRSGYVFAPDGLPRERLAQLCTLKAAGQPLSGALEGRTGSGTQALGEIARHVLSRPILVDVTPADTTGVLLEALGAGFDLVLANKVPLAASQTSVDRLHATAHRAGRRILHEATVGAGLPVIDTLRKLLDAGDEVISIEGCPSGTLGFLFGALGRGETFSSALRDAVARGFAETDPRVDLSGVDVARKALILARAIGFRGELGDVSVESLVAESMAALSRQEFLSRAGDLDDTWAARVAAATRE